MVPLRAIAEAFGWAVTWNGKEQSITVDTRTIWIGENEGFNPEQEWREGMFHLAAAPVIIDNLTFVPASFFPAQVFEGQLVIGGDCLNRAAGIVIGVGSATEERLSNYDSYVRFADPIGTGFSEIIIVPHAPLRDFWWFELGTNWGEPFYFYIEEVLSAPGDITPARPFVVNWGHMGTAAYRGISFLDEYGERRYFVINDSQADFEESLGGFVMIYEFTPGVSPW